jgi:transcriptional regulator with XRE-family HTH domain
MNTIGAIELATPVEILDQLIVKIKEKQKLLGLTASDIETKADITPRHYSNFLYNKNTHLLTLIKILKVLDMEKELSSLIEPIIPKDASEHKKLQKIRKNITLKIQHKEDLPQSNQNDTKQKRISLVNKGDK